MYALNTYDLKFEMDGFSYFHRRVEQFYRLCHVFANICLRRGFKYFNLIIVIFPMVDIPILPNIFIF